MKKLFGVFMSICSCLLAQESTAQKFDWDQLIFLPEVEAYWWEGRQVLNFLPYDKHYTNKEEVKTFVQTQLQGAEAIDTDAGHLKYCSDHVTIDGAYLEMGVCTGRTINFIAALNPKKVIYGFDSFEGLPGDWIRPDIHIPKNTYGYKDPNKLPAVLHNVKLIKGWFEETLPKFKEKILKDTPIALINIDCDMYEPTKTVLDVLGDNLVSGSVVIFDEYYNYPGHDEHEFKAFQEFLARTGKKARPLAFNEYFQQASFVIE